MYGKTKIINPVKTVGGEINPPSSKSYAIRAMICSIFSKGQCTLSEVDISGDIASAISVAEALGCSVDYDLQSRSLSLDSSHLDASLSELNVGESGLLARIFLAVSCVFDTQTTITAKGSLLTRSFACEKSKFDLLGINYSSENEYLPIQILPSDVNFGTELDCSDGSQFLTGLLFFAVLNQKETTIKVKNLVSKHYIDLTIAMMQNFGVKIENKDYSEFYIAASQKFIPTNLSIEADWSGVSCLAVAGVLCGKSLRFKNLCESSLQPDASLKQIFDYIGCDSSFEGTDFVVSTNHTDGFCVDLTDTPDLFPALVALASLSKGISTLCGTERLMNKESNRLDTLLQSFKALGVKMYASQQNQLIIFGGDIEGGVELYCHNDHRIAMSLAVASLVAQQPVILHGIECVEKSYPNFWQDFDKILRK